jgi:hypothetical protein
LLWVSKIRRFTKTDPEIAGHESCASFVKAKAKSFNRNSEETVVVSRRKTNQSAEAGIASIFLVVDPSPLKDLKDICELI